MKVAFIICLIALAYIIHMTYLIHNPDPEAKAEATVIKQPELIYSPDGKYLVSVNYEENTLKIFDIGKGIEIQNFKSDSNINSVSYSPDSKTIAVMEKNNKITLFSLETGKLTKTF